MNKWIKSFVGAGFLLTASSANAVLLNFNTMAEASGSHGESAWNSLDFSFTDFDLSITGVKEGKAGYAYLDSNNGGLGVCGKLHNILDADKITQSSTNLCAPSSDDNMTYFESLSFVFTTDVEIETIWFNNNHDGDRSVYGDLINIGGSPYLFTTGGAAYETSFTTSPFLVDANTPFDISFNNEQFYVHAIEFNPVNPPEGHVPAPMPLALIALGLAGIFLTRKNIRKS